MKELPGFEDAVAHAKIGGVPEALRPLYDQFSKDYAPHPLMRRAFLAEACDRFDPGDKGRDRLHAALDEIEADPVLLMLSNFLRADICAARHRLDLDDYHAMQPECGMQNKDLYSFLILLSCIEPSMSRLAKRGVPEESYQKIAFTMVEKQMKKLRETGNGKVDDFPWDMNFYTCSIFRIGRFFFIPFKLDDAIAVYRRKDETVAFFSEKTRVRRDGELDGVNGQFDPEAFDTEYARTANEVIGNPISPAGLVLREKKRLDLREWTLVLQKGDILLGTHIPSGPGYDPENLRKSTQEAYAFYRKWFPEIEIKGFGSESWLYDPHLAMVMEGRGNVPAMQRQMYVYPIESGDGMFWHELFGSKKPVEELEAKTSMQKAALAYLKKGGLFTVSSMFILAQDVDRIETGPYAGGDDYARIWESLKAPLPIEPVKKEESL